MTAFIYSYKNSSVSATDISKALGIKKIAHRNSKFEGGDDKLVINWGSSKLPEEVLKSRVINKVESVAIAANKLEAFKALQGLTITPPFTTSASDATAAWLLEGRIVVERHVLNGNSGEGIRLVDGSKGEKLSEGCPLYVLYIPKKQEYRVHVFRGNIVDVQRKARRHDVPDDEINWKIRNHDNGFIFARGEEGLGDVPDCVLTSSLLAVQTIGLDFGAVDVIYNEKMDRAFVLEVNTAPGLTGETLEGYVARFRRLINIFEDGELYDLPV